MAQEVCLDTDAVIALIKGEQRASDLLDKLANARVSITSITAFELRLRETNLDIIDDFIGNVNMLSFDLEAAKKASSIFKELKKSGKMVELRDVFIGAIALSNNIPLLTFNKKHFENIKGLQI